MEKKDIKNLINNFNHRLDINMTYTDNEKYIIQQDVNTIYNNIDATYTIDDLREVENIIMFYDLIINGFSTYKSQIDDFTVTLEKQRVPIANKKILLNKLKAFILDMPPPLYFIKQNRETYDIVDIPINIKQIIGDCKCLENLKIDKCLSKSRNTVTFLITQDNMSRVIKLTNLIDYPYMDNSAIFNTNVEIGKILNELGYAPNTYCSCNVKYQKYQVGITIIDKPDMTLREWMEELYDKKYNNEETARLLWDLSMNCQEWMKNMADTLCKLPQPIYVNERPVFMNDVNNLDNIIINKNRFFTINWTNYAYENMSFGKPDTNTIIHLFLNALKKIDILKTDEIEKIINDRYKLDLHLFP